MTDERVVKFNELQARIVELRAIRLKAIHRNLPGIRELVEHRIAELVREQEAVFA